MKPIKLCERDGGALVDARQQDVDRRRLQHLHQAHQGLQVVVGLAAVLGAGGECRVHLALEGRDLDRAFSRVSFFGWPSSSSSLRSWSPVALNDSRRS